MNDLIAGIITTEFRKDILAATVTSLRESAGLAAFVLTDEKLSGCWQAWLELLRSMVCGAIAFGMRDSYLLLCEDDVIFSRGLHHYLRSNPPPAGSIANLYCTAECHRPELMQWHRQPVPSRAQGSLALLIPLAIAKEIIVAPPFPDRRDGTDHNLGTFCRERDIAFVTHSPSLVLHAKLETSLDTARGREELRQAFCFAESIDVEKTHRQRNEFLLSKCEEELGATFPAGYYGFSLSDSHPSRRRLPRHPHTLTVYRKAGA